MNSDPCVKAQLHRRYPLASLLIYNASTILHFLLGSIGIYLAYSFSTWAGIGAGALYLAFSFVVLYVIMPLAVCTNCFYYRTDDSLCVSGLNVISKKVAQEGEPRLFASRAQGLLSHNNLYVVALMAPVVAMIPGLIINFTWLLFGLFAALLGLLLFRFFVILPRIACLHCCAKHRCPQAEAMGVREL
ncbi:MAG: hypothetical protein PVH41_16855 [Anaerolineae bacterium]|jgi:hypothetical protein